MKHLTLITLLTIFISCNNKIIKSSKNMNTIINKESKRFNSNNFNNTISVLKKTDTKIIQKRGLNIKQSFIEEGSRLSLLDMNNEGQVIRSTLLDVNGEVIVKEKIDNYFDYFEIYYPNGNIKKKVISSDLGFSVGKEYLFNDEGKLIDEVNLDKDYDFTFDEVLNFLSNKNINILLREGFQNTIRKINNNNRKTWVIEYFNSKIDKIEVYVLDGKTGELVITETNNKPDFKHFK